MVAKIFNVANVLSLVRLLLAPVFMILMFSHLEILAFIVLLVATLTDFLDGHIARSYRIQTRLGKLLDPLADKAIILFAVITLLVKFNFPLWIGLLIIGRDVIILFGSITYLHQHKKRTLIPNLLGKATTFVQMVTVVVYFINVSVILKNILLLLTVLLTLFSGAVYMFKGYSLFFDRSKRRINIPNKITLLRIILIPIFIIFLLSEMTYRDYVAAAIFIILSISDALDGYLARKHGQVTNFGKLIDPIADKLLVSSALIFLIGRGIDAWMAFAIIGREFAVTGLRMLALTKHETISAKSSGKLKTVAQIVGITAVILNVPYAWYLMLLAVLITLYSGIEYIWSGRNIIKDLV